MSSIIRNKKKKKSFADELADLMMPAPRAEIDPEREGLEEVAVLEESDEELLEHMEGRHGKEKPRLRGEIDLDEDTYGGTRSSRRKFFGEEEEEEEDEEEEEEDGGDNDRGVVDSEESSDGDSQHINGVEDDYTKLASGATFDNNHINYNSNNKDTDEMDALEREMDEVEAAEAHAAEELKERAAKEYRKAQCVKAQKKLWNVSLESRILMQKVMQGANRLPGAEVHECFDDVDPAIAQDMAAVVVDAQRTISDICAILDALSDQHPDIQVELKKRKAPSASLSACWQSLDERYQSFAPFRDAALDRWHRKTMLSSSSSNMKVLNQGISKQVALLMKDCERIAERSRVPANQFKGLCQWQGSMNRQDTESDVMEETNYTDTGVPNTYMDGEFYQALLNEFLESAGTDTKGKKIHKEPKQRKIVDRRASKGRKIRYHVHEKLVNFMTPDETDLPEYTARIFANLFGHNRTTTV